MTVQTMPVAKAASAHLDQILASLRTLPLEEKKRALGRLKKMIGSEDSSISAKSLERKVKGLCDQDTVEGTRSALAILSNLEKFEARVADIHVRLREKELAKRPEYKLLERFKEQCYPQIRRLRAPSDPKIIYTSIADTLTSSQEDEIDSHNKQERERHKQRVERQKTLRLNLLPSLTGFVMDRALRKTCALESFKELVLEMTPHQRGVVAGLVERIERENGINADSFLRLLKID